ncbi:MAG: lysine 2,3-aminomutase [Pseudobdellovibrio sp.]|jgi:lysine 2,3-aminomutase|nr:lysine 2,3-aminomutase [Pseudobdellovibrio sp.]
MKFTWSSAPKPDSAPVEKWLDWTWQLQTALKNVSDFEKSFELSESEKKAFESGSEIFNIRCTPYYASLASKTNQYDPIRRILLPHEKELFDPKQAQLDPLGERKSENNPVRRIVHRYSDRVLFLVTDICSVYCRYCTRKHFTGADQAFLKTDEYEEALNYIRNHTGIREVILSGGDPLTVSDAKLEKVLGDLRKIDHIEIIRIGSRMPVVAPMRVTDDLVRILKKHKPVFMMTHFNHPRELTAEAASAVEKFVDNGVPVMNQMVLLNGVNNHPAIVQALSRRLLFLRAKPYYMFQCDPSVGTDHLRTSIDNSLQIQRELWGHLSGLAMPQLSVDIPDGGGKAYYAPQFEVSRTEEARKFIGWDGVESEYVNPAAQDIRIPIDTEMYVEEWENLKAAKRIL